jgi:beta-glucosidase
MNRLILVLKAAALAALIFAPLTFPARGRNAAAYEHPFRNPDLPAGQRIDNLISLMTLDEKVACLGTNPSVPRLGVKGSGHSEGLHGLAQGGPSDWGRKNPTTTTIFPQAIGLAETWDTDVVRRVAEVEGFEARYIFQKYNRGGIVVRAPNADLGRDPRWGRTEECYGEDPFFNGTLVTAYVRGLQGPDPKYWRAASLLKHFLANSNENGRGHTSSDFDERLFREYYSVPFRMGIEEGGARAFMASYNKVNGVPMHVNREVLDITRDEWGQDGIICTDGGGMRQLVTDHKRFATVEEAAAAVVETGIGQFLDDYRGPARAALAKGLLTEADVDKVLRHTFRVMLRLGLLDPPDRVPYSKIGEGPEPWATDEHKSLARLVTQKSVVLLKNSGGLLPLDRAKLKSIAVIGPHADEVLLDWYSGTPPYTVTPLAGIRERAGPRVRVDYAKGDDGGAVERVARACEVAVVVVGNHPTCDAGWEQCPVPSDGKEAVDRRSITLEQEELVRRVYAANPNTVVVLKSSFPFAVNWTQANVPAVLHLTHSSQEEGHALADVLFGDYNPAGRLVQTWPASVEQLPPMMDYDIRHGRTYMYFRGAPLYPFGYGLSYTTFAYSNLRTSSRALAADGSVRLTFDLKNTGRRAGEEVAQLYVTHLGSKVERPQKELKGFARLALRPGETKRVTLTLAAERLAYWDVKSKRFVVEPDRIRLMVGGSSADVRLSRELSVLGAR